jgi:DnaJ-class molecular chaperone
MSSTDPPMPPDSPDVCTDVCDACGGTGIEEGREWDGEHCAECKGKGFVEYINDPAEWYD